MPHLHRTLAAAMLLAACNGGNGLGEHCAIVSDCDSDLQCLDHTCVPRCRHHVDCGDGMRCDDGVCTEVESQINDPCSSELQCGVGQTCRLNVQLSTVAGSCQAETATGIPGALCKVADDCRSGACALGHCVELCARDDDCARGSACAAIPFIFKINSFLGNFDACLPTSGSMSFEIPLPLGTEPEVKIPVPSTAQSMVLVTEVADPTKLVSGTWLASPTGEQLYQLPQTPDDFYNRNAVRHGPQPGVSVLKIPSSTDVPLEPGAYTFRLAQIHVGAPELVHSPLRLRVVEKLGTGATLDLHLYFGDLAQHPCNARIGGDLDATSAQSMIGFQDVFLAELRSIFQHANIATGEITYADVRGHPELDTLTSANAGSLFSLATDDTGVSVFFVRSISPAGVQVITNGTPGAPLAGTPASGVAVSLEPMCYRDWTSLARQTAHAVARQLGLFRNVEPRNPVDGVVYEDPIDDSPPTVDNLMHYSELGGTTLTTGQREVLRSSPALQ